MTLRRTIHRRAARKRAKVRAEQPRRSLICTDWLVKDRLRELSDNLKMADLINREYAERV